MSECLVPLYTVISKKLTGVRCYKSKYQVFVTRIPTDKEFFILTLTSIVSESAVVNKFIGMININSNITSSVMSFIRIHVYVISGDGRAPMAAPINCL